MNILVRVAAFLAGLAASATAAAQPAAPPPAENEPAAPTYLFEWMTRTGTASRRLTLFGDGILVRKSVSQDGKTDFKKRKLSAEEYSFYSEYFGSPESREGIRQLRDGSDGRPVGEIRDFVRSPRRAPVVAVVRLVLRAVGPRVESEIGARGASRFVRQGAAERKRFSDREARSGDPPSAPRRPGFRIVHVDEQAKVVEARAVGQPYSQFFQWAKLRYSFFPP